MTEYIDSAMREEEEVKRKLHLQEQEKCREMRSVSDNRLPVVYMYIVRTCMYDCVIHFYLLAIGTIKFSPGVLPIPKDVFIMCIHV